MLKKIYKKRIYCLVAIFFVLNGCQTKEDKQHISPIKPISQANSSTQKAFLDAVNKVRATEQICGENTYPAVSPLKWNTQLYAAALEHSNDMAKSNTFSHDGSGTKYDITGGNSPSRMDERIKENEYTSYSHLAENIAAGQHSIEDVMQKWMSSTGHCHNIMGKDFRELGMALVTNQNSRYQTYWTQNFGARR